MDGNTREHTDTDGWRITACEYESAEHGPGTVACTVYAPDGREAFHTGNAALGSLEEPALAEFLGGCRELTAALAKHADRARGEGHAARGGATFTQRGEAYVRNDLIRWACSECGRVSWSFERKAYWPRYCPMCGARVKGFERTDGKEGR